MRKRAFFAAGAAVGAAAAMVAARSRLRRFEIVEESMRPALEPGDWVLAHRLTGRPHRGDIVIFEHADRPGLSLVKRVVALPGETLEIRDGHVLIDGTVLPEPWASGFAQPSRSWEVPEGTMFVLGDHRVGAGGDSRTLGPIDVGALAWRVFARYWPTARIGPVSSG